MAVRGYLGYINANFSFSKSQPNAAKRAVWDLALPSAGCVLELHPVGASLANAWKFL